MTGEDRREIEHMGDAVDDIKIGALLRNQYSILPLLHHKEGWNVGHADLEHSPLEVLVNLKRIQEKATGIQAVLTPVLPSKVKLKFHSIPSWEFGTRRVDPCVAKLFVMSIAFGVQDGHSHRALLS